MVPALVGAWVLAEEARLTAAKAEAGVSAGEGSGDIIPLPLPLKKRKKKCFQKKPKS